MGCAESIALDQVRASKQWATLRQKLHERLDRWLDALEVRRNEPQPTLTEVTHVVWDLRQHLTGRLTETLVMGPHQAAGAQTYASCPEGACLVKTRGSLPRTLETLVGPIQVRRPYFYCGACHGGFYPFATR